MVGPFTGVLLNHIARETENVLKTAQFYKEIFGFQNIQTPKEFGDSVVWLSLPPSHSLHIIKRNPESRLPESPFTATDDARRDERALPMAHHLSFRVSDYDAAIELLKEKSIPYYEKTQQEGRIKQAFFFDPDGNGLEIGNWPIEQ
ncbi:hypothetical protein MPTK1_5g16330 [Marchantia polymorpha subsp. ruderalis]|uniref:VOC domain-containing protein n=2 Tax=Marchantia polymorpha TaxID=3197 RepID=A0A176VKE7_MARPO|nr:hypothetical protein AXG93_1748s1180 [Marchantia polymorpha subsp. ruderalis]PTQ27746.1 hypothetical protein MARPO_0185s0021 [Marchantia polymorpha]BBN11965.1 hypothetical protein Mp_5g16330 [Marchantia polymorpha subsp. ruderalis]|eukprot:PTQ27746.1 hypothetical protein MARPO_0185s0021 [Marchantia polymorpha]